MEYLSALGPLLILMLFGGGLVIAAYLTFDDMRSRGGSFDTAAFVASIRNTVERIRALPTTTLIMIGAVAAAVLFIYLVSASGYYARPATEATTASAPAIETAAPAAAPAATAPEPAAKAAPAPAPAPAAKTPPAADKQAAVATPTAIASVRNVTSTSCASDGCPVTCADNETLTSAYCVNGGAARLADQLTVKDGSVTAKCSPSASAIKVACARK
jgi:cytoskeletal protein RodZ